MQSTDWFETQLLSLIVRDSEHYKKISGYIDLWHFGSPLGEDLFSSTADYYKTYTKLPTQQELLFIYKQGRKVDDDTQIVGFIKHLYESPVNEAFVYAELNRYIRIKKLEILTKTTYDKLKLGEELDCSNYVTEIFKVQSEFGLDNMYGIGLENAAEMLEEDLNRPVVPTNIQNLNAVLNGGGLQGGQLGIILAPPNHGKTMTLLNFACHAYLKEKKNVLFVTLEMKEASILRRCMYMFLGFFKGTNVKVINLDVLHMIKDTLKKEFRIFHRPIRTVTVDLIYSVYNRALADGIKFDIMFIDYLDLLTPTSRYTEKRHELSSITEGLKSIAQILNIPVWTATQTNREGLRAGQVGMEHTSEDISKAFTADVMVSLGEKIDKNKTVEMFVPKNREGKSDVEISVFVDENMVFESTMIQSVDLTNLKI